MQSTARPSCSPEKGCDCYVRAEVEPNGEVRYAVLCSQSVRRYASDLWQAEMYLRQLCSAAT